MHTCQSATVFSHDWEAIAKQSKRNLQRSDGGVPKFMSARGQTVLSPLGIENAKEKEKKGMRRGRSRWKHLMSA
jgi:hypothetical protein